MSASKRYRPRSSLKIAALQAIAGPFINIFEAQPSYRPVPVPLYDLAPVVAISARSAQLGRGLGAIALEFELDVSAAATCFVEIPGGFGSKSL